jgi:hypothetical protein
MRLARHDVGAHIAALGGVALHGQHLEAMARNGSL